MNRIILKGSNKRMLTCYITFLLAIVSFALPEDSNKKKDYILFISTINIEQALSNELYWYVHNHIQNDKFHIAIESLSIPAINDVQEVQTVIEKFAQKYKDPPRVIILGDLGWMVCRELFDTVWKEIPAIVIESHNYAPTSLEHLFSKTPLTPKNKTTSEEWRHGYNVTAIKQPLFIKETISLIKQLTPQINKLALIADDRYTSFIIREETNNILKNHFPEIELINLSNMPTEQMLDSLLSFDKNTGVIYNSWFELTTKDNNFYLADHIQDIIGAFSTNPLFTLTDQGTSTTKFAGGHYVSIKAIGEELTKVLDRILAGTPARDIPTAIGGDDHSYLNYPYLLNHGIPAQLYPIKGAIHLNPPLSFYQSYKDEIILFLVCIMLTIIIVFYHIKSFKQKERMRIFYESVLNNLPVGIAITGTKKDSKYRFFNKQTSKFFDSTQDITGDNHNTSPNKEFVKEMKLMNQDIAQTKSRSSIIKEYTRKNGEKRFYKIGKDIIPYNKTQLRTVSTITDVSDILLNKERLKLLNKKYELTLTIAELESWSINLTEKKVLFQDLIIDIEHANRFIHPDDHHQLMLELNELFIGKKEKLHIEYRVKNTRGNIDYIWVSTFCAIEKRDEKDQPTSIICASLDITSSKLLEFKLRDAKEKAEEANRIKSAFITNMSHEIRTPLNSIIGFSEIIADTENRNDRQKLRKVICDNNQLLLQLINDILDISKMESGHIEFNYNRIDLNHIIDEVSQTATNKKSELVKIQINKPLDSCIIQTDEERISQVFNNLITNAIKFTLEGDISIGYSILPNNQVYCYVKDTGKGITEAEQKQIFDRFFKADAFTQGTGLGLPLCEMIIRELGGFIGVKSEKGIGSEFWFILPLEKTNI